MFLFWRENYDYWSKFSEGSMTGNDILLASFPPIVPLFSSTVILFLLVLVVVGFIDGLTMTRLLTNGSGGYSCHLRNDAHTNEGLTSFF